MAVSIELKDLRVRSLDVDFHELSWKIADTSEDVLDYTFQVFRSESPSGPFNAISEPFDDRYVFIDKAIQIANRWRKYFYKVTVAYKPSGATEDFGPVTNEPDPDVLARELRRHMQLLFTEFAGRRLWVLPARTFGQRCECWNATLKKQTRSGCRTCFDTGFVRGYMSPIEVFGQLDPSPKADQQTNVGKMQQSNTTGRLGYYPPLKPEDLIIEAENRRWRVTKVSMTEQGRAPVHQEIELHEIPRTDIEFAVPLNMDTALKDLWISPKRNFSNPMNLEAFEEQELPNIVNLYGMKRKP
jgi:hypothetical protein